MNDFRDKMARLAVENLADAVIMVDPQRRITQFNPAAERLSGFSRAEAVGKYCGDVLRGKLCGERCPLLASLGEMRTVRDAESSILTKDQAVVPVMISTSCLLSPEGELLGAVEVIKDLTEIKRAERERQNLISMLAHDMKSPAVVIEGFACRLLRRLPLGDKERQELEIIREEARRLSGFIRNWLEYSRLRSGMMAPSLSACNLEGEVCATVESLSVEAQGKDISVVVNAPPGPVVVDGDCGLLRRAVTNLIANAIKFTEPGGRVVVEIATEGDEAQIRVNDTGCGIAPEDLPYVFEPFNRGSAQKPGTGLGLAIVEAVAKVHHGRVFVASELGRGSTFTLLVPISRSKRWRPGEGGGGGRREAV